MTYQDKNLASWLLYTLKRLPMMDKESGFVDVHAVL